MGSDREGLVDVSLGQDLHRQALANQAVGVHLIGPDLGFRLDQLLCSPEAADRLRGAGVDKWARGEEKASDHAPTWIELE